MDIINFKIKYYWVKLITNFWISHFLNTKRGVCTMWSFRCLSIFDFGTFKMFIWSINGVRWAWFISKIFSIFILLPSSWVSSKITSILEMMLIVHFLKYSVVTYNFIYSYTRYLISLHEKLLIPSYSI